MRLGELAYWKTILSGRTGILPGVNTGDFRGAKRVAGSFSLKLAAATTTKLLTEVPAVFHARINDVLLAALFVAIAEWRRCHGYSSNDAILLDVEGHGRREEISQGSRSIPDRRMVHDSLYPVRLEAGPLDLVKAYSGGRALGQVVKLVKEQLRSVPDSGIGYGLLRYLNPQTEQILAEFDTPLIGFNYLGRFDSGGQQDWRLTLESGPLAVIERGERPILHSVEINAITLDRGQAGSQFIATWLWMEPVQQQEIREVAGYWHRALEMLVHYVTEPGAGGLTPSDVPLVSLSQAEIERLEAEHQ